MIYFVIAIIALCVYMGFMILKATMLKKSTKFVIFLHGATALFAIITFLLLWKNEFEIRLLSLFGLTLILLGILIEIVAFGAIKSRAFMKENELVTKGVYNHVRNPIYLGFIIAAFGAVLFSFSLYVLIYAFLLMLLYMIVIKLEEKELQKRFGKKYEEYKKRVPALIPKF